MKRTRPPKPDYGCGEVTQIAPGFCRPGQRTRPIARPPSSPISACLSPIRSTTIRVRLPHRPYREAMNVEKEKRLEGCGCRTGWRLGGVLCDEPVPGDRQ